VTATRAMARRIIRSPKRWRAAARSEAAALACSAAGAAAGDERSESRIAAETRKVPALTASAPLGVTTPSSTPPKA
jgi:hypothetical protein